MNEVFVQASTELAVLAAKGTAATINNKFKAIRSNKQFEEVCNSYEELINELVAERAQAIALAQAYEDELKRFEITEEDIEHLHATVTNVLDIFKTFSPETDTRTFEQLKSLISVDTLKAMQLLGFNYKEAIGTPLTKACANAIEKKLGASKAGNTQSGNAKRKR